MASSMQTVPAEAFAGTDATSDGDYTVVSTPASSSPSEVTGTSSDGSSDLCFWFGQMGVPHPQKWARKFHAAGHGDMDELMIFAAPELDAVFSELAVPSGIQNKIRVGIQQFQAGTLGQTSMPLGDLDATAPVQSKGIDWWFWGEVAAVAAVGVAGSAVLWASHMAAAAAVQKAAAEKAAAAAAAEKAAAAAKIAAEKKAAEAAAKTASANSADPAGGVFAAVGLGTLGTVACLAPLVVDCLDGETLVTMAARSTKKIKDVKVGDKILSYNKNKFRVKTVVELKEGSSNTMRELFLQSPDGNDFRIKATGGHPFYKEKDWAVISPDDAHFDASKPVKKLSVGDTLVLRGGAGAKLLKIGAALPRQKTYNLAIDGPGTFFVEGILSHSGLPPKK